MANPQKEKGYTAIANEIMDALAKIRIPGLAWQVLAVVLRNSYGWNRKNARLSFGYIAEATGIERGNVGKQIKILKDMNILSVVENNHTTGNIWQFNKDFTKWKVRLKNTTVVKSNHTAVVDNYPTPVVEYYPQQSKDLKTKINKTIPSSETTGMKDEVNLIFNCFYETINPQINFARKDSRDAAAWLVAKYGFENTLKAAQYACLIFAENYAPQIKTPAELKDKWANLVKFKNQQDNGPER